MSNWVNYYDRCMSYERFNPSNMGRWSPLKHHIISADDKESKADRIAYEYKNLSSRGNYDLIYFLLLMPNNCNPCNH